MSDPFLPVPPEATADAETRRELDDLESDRQPDVLQEPAEHDEDELAAAARAAAPAGFRTPAPGDRLTAEEAEQELG